MESVISERQPLGTCNGPPSRMTLSKLPTPSFNRLDTNKRKQEQCLSSSDEKKPRLNLSSCSDTSTSSAPTSLPASKPAVPSAGSGKGSGNTKPGARVTSRAAAVSVVRPAGNVKKPTTGNIRKGTPPVATVKPARAKPAASCKPPVQTPKLPNNSSKGNVPSSSRKPASTTAGLPAGGGRKRAAWDVKGRLLDMEDAMAALLHEKAAVEAQSSQHSELYLAAKSQTAQLSTEVARRGEDCDRLQQRIDTLHAQIKAGEEDLEMTTKKFRRELSDMEFDKCQLERQRAALQSELEASQQEVAGLKATVASLSGLTAELSAVKLSLETALEAGRQKDAEINELRERGRQQDETIENCGEKMRQHETERRRLHNVIQELKGNIRVFCRVRPLLSEQADVTDNALSHISFPDDERRILELKTEVTENGTSARPGSCSKYEFNFDRVFSPADCQADVFEEISQLIQSALDGYNVCIFAYGQTGSGKTYTMEGGGRDDTRGMIPRAVTQIFSTAEGLQQKGWKYELEVSFFEIYKETIRDLLGNGKEDVKHEIKMVSANSSEVTISNLTNVMVTEESQVYGLLKKASDNRVVAETKCNKRSSRSHSVFRMKLTGFNSVTDEKSVGVLHLIDLAGSERLKESGSQGERLKETQSINASLANLGNVIMALANKDSHIPYRNSKLTHLLQNCLGGSSKTLMFVNVSPQEECFTETLNSLRFATKVNSCNIGTAQKRCK